EWHLRYQVGRRKVCIRRCKSQIRVGKGVAGMAGKELRDCSLFSGTCNKQSLQDALNSFFSIEENAAQQDTLAILYTPNKCFLAKVEQDQHTTASSRDS